MEKKIVNQLHNLRSKKGALLILGLNQQMYERALQWSQNFLTYSYDPILDRNTAFALSKEKNKLQMKENKANQLLQNSQVYYVTGQSTFSIGADELRQYALTLGHNIKKGNWIIMDETISPQYAEFTLLPLIHENSGLIAGRDFEIAFLSQEKYREELRELPDYLKLSHNLIIRLVLQLIGERDFHAQNCEIDFFDSGRQYRQITQLIKDEWLPVMNFMDKAFFHEFYHACLHKGHLNDYPNLKFSHEIKPNPQRFFMWAKRFGLKHALPDVQDNTSGDRMYNSLSNTAA